CALLVSAASGISTLSLHDALPISRIRTGSSPPPRPLPERRPNRTARARHRHSSGVSVAGWTGARSAGPVMATSADSSSLSHVARSEEHTSELQSRENLVCRLLLEK